MASSSVTLLTARHVHLVGIGGSGMAALATLLLQMGTRLSGSDVSESETIRRLRGAGARVVVGHASENVGDADFVVRSSAIPAENPEVQEAAQRGIPSVKLAEAVGSLMKERRGVAVAGTHGKTTTTALVAWLLDRGGVDPLALIGADALNYGGSARGGSGPMVIEADEYDRRFLQLSPSVAVVTSVEEDHLDYFRDVREIQETFQAFVNLLPPDGRLVACADDEGASALRSPGTRVTYGFSSDADWRASDYHPVPGGGARFTVHACGRAWKAESPLTGEHNAQNALAALAAADAVGVDVDTALVALRAFRGTRRRFETKGHPRGVWVVDDYAHHPTALEVTLRAARAAHRGPIWAVFQPHTTHRTAALLEPFARSLQAADHALVLPIYQPSGREKEPSPVTSGDLVARARARGHGDVRLVSDFDEALAILTAEPTEGSMILTLGAGDVTLLASRLVAALEAQP